MNNTRRQRIAFVDALKCFAIFLVIWGHVIQYFQPLPYAEIPMYRIIYSFHMPLFMMLSGYFAVNIFKRDWGTVLQQKTIQLLLPVVSFSLIFNVLIGGGNFVLALYKGYWFLKSLFFCTLLYFICGKLFSRHFITALVISILLSQCIPLWQFNKMYPCFIVGTLLARKTNWIMSNSKRVLIYSGMIFFTLLCFFDSSFWEPFSAASVTSTMTYVFHNMYRFIIGIAGALMFFSLFYISSLTLDRTPLREKFLSFGQDTLGIYVVQTILLESFLAQRINFENTDTTIFSLLISPIIAIILTLACVSCVRILRKSTMTKLLFLGEKTNRK